jgi:hypothetical protein
MPLHVLFVPQGVPEATGVSTGMPLLHEAVSHTLPLVGTSVLSVTEVTFPMPSHTFFLQSPAVCMLTTVPFAAYEKPQVLAMQVRVWHSVSVPGQVVAWTHWTQEPLPLHTLPVPQAMPAGALFMVTDPIEQPGTVQGLVGAGTSMLSKTMLTAPMPLHTFFLQSPGVCMAVAVPAAV